MGWFSSDSDEGQAYNQLQSGEVHKSSISHELIAGAASFEAAKAWENHCAANGKPTSHGEAKEFLAAAIGTFVDHETETRGLDFIDKERAKHEAKKNAEAQLQNEY